MSERSTAIRQVDGDPSGSIFLPENIETADDLARIRQQIIFGRGLYRAARLSAGEIQDLLDELERFTVRLQVAQK